MVSKLTATRLRCTALGVTRQGYWYLTHRDTPWKYEGIAEKCGTLWQRMNVMILMVAARKSDDLLLKRDFTAAKPFEKCVTDITEIPARYGKLYVSAIFDCYDLGVLGLAMADNMKANLCVSTIENADKPFPSIRGAVIHNDRGSQYTSVLYRAELSRCGIVQSMNSAGGRCHDNARCEAMWARMKEKLLYGRYNTKKMTIEELKTLIWRYFIVYWNTRRICSANGGLPPIIKRKRYYESLEQAA